MHPLDEVLWNSNGHIKALHHSSMILDSHGLQVGRKDGAADGVNWFYWASLQILLVYAEGVHASVGD